MAKKQKEEAKLDKPVITTEEKRTLKVVLTETELLEAGAALATAPAAYRRTRSRVAGVQGRQQGQGRTGGSDHDPQFVAVRQKYDYREVKCSVRKDWNSEMVHVIRADTAETVESRPMTNAELSELPLDDARK